MNLQHCIYAVACESHANLCYSHLPLGSSHLHHPALPRMRVSVEFVWAEHRKEQHACRSCAHFPSLRMVLGGEYRHSVQEGTAQLLPRHWTVASGLVRWSHKVDATVKALSAPWTISNLKTWALSVSSASCHEGQHTSTLQTQKFLQAHHSVLSLHEELHLAMAVKHADTNTLIFPAPFLNITLGSPGILQFQLSSTSHHVGTQSQPCRKAQESLRSGSYQSFHLTSLELITPFLQPSSKRSIKIPTLQLYWHRVPT